MPTIDVTGPMVSAFADLAAESEKWKATHDLLAACHNYDSAAELGVRLFRELLAIEATFQTEFHANDAGGPAIDRLFALLQKNYTRLFRSFEQTAEGIEWLENRGHFIANSEQFTEAFDELRWMLESRVLEAEMRPREELLPLVSDEPPNPDRYGY